MQKPFDPYNINFNGHKLDPYRVIDLFQITNPALQQAVKKLLRCGSKHKTAEEDARDCITSCQRFLDMKAEERAWANQPELPFAENHTCPICDGGPGNNGVCVCPKS
jgi:hypothetical protein